MVRATSPRVGFGICPDPHCAKPVLYRRSSGGHLTHKCDHCISTGYAEQGGKAHARRMETIEQDDGEQHHQEPAPKAPEKPAPKQRKAFDLGDV